MTITTRRTAAAITALLLTAQGALAQDCQPQHEFTTITPGTLTVAVTTLIPFSWLDDAGVMKGVDNAVATEFAARECLTLTPVAVDPAAAIQYVMMGQADIAVGNWYRTAERAKVMNLSAPLYTDQMGIYSVEGLSTVAELEGKQVGTVQGYLWVSDLKKLLGDDLKLYPSSVDMQQDLKSGRIAVGIDSYATGVIAGQQGALGDIQVMVSEPDERVRATVDAAQAGMPYAKTATEFGAALDAVINDLHAEGVIGQILEAHGLDASAGDVGAPRLIE